MTTCIITIDGPSGSGKGSLALLVARELGFHILDSGAIYRLAALQVLRKQVNQADESAVLAAISSMQISFKSGDELTIPFLDGEDVSKQIREEKTAASASVIAAYPTIREQLLQLQRDFAQPPGLVADGRDMGTVVFPEAKIKLYLHASAEERAKRRYKQLIDMGLTASIADLQREIEIRDERDKNRPVSPLVPATDAVVVDSSMMDLQHVFELVMDHIQTVIDSIAEV
jgi:CMP/dCMP kinase